MSPEGFKQSLLVHSLMFFFIVAQGKGKKRDFDKKFRGLN